MSRRVRWHLLQHAPFEGPGYLANWLEERDFDWARSELWTCPDLPGMDDFDALAVLGGPMNVYDDLNYPWLAMEKVFLERAIAASKPVLGICFGAQLLAVVLGGSVIALGHREIGWFPVELTSEGRKSRWFRDIPDRFMALHWHGDQFIDPPGAVHFATSRGCAAQCFGVGAHILGIQFHLESDETTIDDLICNCGHELERGVYVQTPDALRAGAVYLDRSHQYFAMMLDRFSQVVLSKGPGTPAPR